MSLHGTCGGGFSATEDCRHMLGKRYGNLVVTPVSSSHMILAFHTGHWTLPKVATSSSFTGIAVGTTPF